MIKRGDVALVPSQLFFPYFDEYFHRTGRPSESRNGLVELGD
jgi:hypothetical protein